MYSESYKKKMDRDRKILKQMIEKINVNELNGDDLDSVSSMLDYAIWLMTSKLKECLEKQIKSYKEEEEEDELIIGIDNEFDEILKQGIDLEFLKVLNKEEDEIFEKFN
jgi:hypothetical protein